MMKYLNILSEKIFSLDMTGEIIWADGVSLLLVHVASDVSKDLDGLYEPKVGINSYVKKIAWENNLSED
jgi:hypothetical protein